MHPPPCARVGQGPSSPCWLAIAFGFWSGRALATGTAWAGLCLIHHNHCSLPHKPQQGKNPLRKKRSVSWAVLNPPATAARHTHTTARPRVKMARDLRPPNLTPRLQSRRGTRSHDAGARALRGSPSGREARVEDDAQHARVTAARRRRQCPALRPPDPLDSARDPVKRARGRARERRLDEAALRGQLHRHARLERDRVEVEEVGHQRDVHELDDKHEDAHELRAVHVGELGRRIASAGNERATKRARPAPSAGGGAPDGTAVGRRRRRSKRRRTGDDQTTTRRRGSSQ